MCPRSFLHPNIHKAGIRNRLQTMNGTTHHLNQCRTIAQVVCNFNANTFTNSLFQIGCLHAGQKKCSRQKFTKEMKGQRQKMEKDEFP